MSSTTLAVPREGTKKITHSWNETIGLALDKQVKAVVKLARYTLFYVEQGLNRVPESMVSCGKQLGNFKNMLSIRELHKGIPASFKAISEVAAKRSIPAAKEAMLTMGKCFNSVADAVEVSAVFMPLNAFVCDSIKRANVLVTGVCASAGSVMELQAFFAADREENVEKQISSLLKLATSVSYAAFAAICMFTAASPFSIVSCLASGTVFGLTSFFYDMMQDPYGKNYKDCAALMDRVQLAS